MWISRIIEAIKRKKKTREIVIDIRTFKECVPKEVVVCSWRTMKQLKYIIHFEKGKYHIYQVGASQMEITEIPSSKDL